MRKVFVIAVREYLATVRTKGFIISLLLMPVLMSGGFLAQKLVGEQVDIRARKIGIVDRSPDAQIAALLRDRAAQHNNSAILDPVTGNQVLPAFDLEVVPPREEVVQQRFDLSERVRRKELDGFLEIEPVIYELPKPQRLTASEIEAIGRSPGPARTGPSALRYQSDHLLDDAFQRWAGEIIAEYVYARRLRKEAKLDLPPDEVKAIFTPVWIDAKELSRIRDGRIEEGRDENKVLQLMVPFGLLMLMFMVIMVGATPLMQGVVEEKMQRIAEVLLGSVRPFHLMLGKLIGTVGVSLTLVVFYLGGAYYAAQKYGVSDRLPPEVIAWFITYQIMAVIMYGSLFIAVGAACTDMKETQSLMWPVMVLAMLPLFVALIVIKEPNSTFATWISLFPPATPMLMIAREAVPPGIPIWQPVVGIALVLIATLLCVYAAGRIFRVGILMQGKGAKVGEMIRWVFRG